MLYTLMRTYRDEFGKTQQRRYNMRQYKNLELVKARADSIKGGYVCPLGTGTPIYVGSWQ